MTNKSLLCLTVIVFGLGIPILIAKDTLAPLKDGVVPQSPNVVLIFADDLGYGDLGCYGATKVQTPNIDRLAAEGRRFTDAHSASAVCTPSRYALLTGEYPVRSNDGKGVWGPAPVTSGLIIDTDKLTIADVFKSEGYATAALGKWHLGFGEGTNDWQEPLRPGPQDLGFDYYFGLPVVNSAPPYVYVENDRIVGGDPTDPLVYLGRGTHRDATPITEIPPEASQRTANQFKGAVEAHKKYNDYTVGTVLADKAVDWITANKQKPFFLYLATTHIHHPFTPGTRFQGTSDADLYGDFIQELDWMVGQVASCLEKHGLSDNTLIIFTSDNGGMMNLGGRNAVKAGHKINGDLLGFKFGVWEGGHRVPFIAKWPGKIEAGTRSDQLICNVDMLATFTALTGQNVDALQGKDSVNVLPALLGDPEEPIRKELLLAARSERHLSIRKGKWMYIPSKGSGGFAGSKPHQHAWGGPAAVALVGGVNSDFENGRFKQNAPPAQLYDLEADVNQARNLYNEYPEVVRELEALLATYKPTASNTPKTNSLKQAGSRDGSASVSGTVTCTHSALEGIGSEKGVMRRDPSNVIKVGDLYYVWYSKGKISPGYDATIWYATSLDGHTWTEKGMALAKGKTGTWEGASVFTPNILVAEGKCWLFYTGVSRPYKRSYNPDSKIGIAVSDSPDGPWQRLATNPALKNSDAPEDFDSHLVDDACLIVRDGKYWCYYKGRQLGRSPAQTQMGLAIADRPQGPYVKHKANPVIPGNHEVLVWPQGTGVAAMIGTTGPKHITNTIQYAEDGIHFTKTHDVKSGPWAGGAYRPEAFTQSGTGDLPEWGVEIGRPKRRAGSGNQLPFIQRFDVTETK